jgi:acylglycerol lipase
MSPVAEVAASPPVDTCPGHPQMAEAWQRSKVRYLSSGGLEIPIRVFGDEGTKTPVVLVHGLQSHSGWFVQCGRYLSELGHPVYAPDRRGSGLSRAARGHAASYEDMLEDLAAVVEHAVQGRSHGHVHLLGHCFGAIPVALFAQREPQRLRSLILATPALYTQVTVPVLARMRILWSRLTGVPFPLPVPYPKELLTDQEPYLHFIQEDQLVLQTLTSRFFFEVFRARTALLRSGRPLAMPVFMALAGHDALADNRGNAEFHRRKAPARSQMVTYGSARHILEFSPERDAFFGDLGDWLRRLDQV